MDNLKKIVFNQNALGNEFWLIFNFGTCKLTELKNIKKYYENSLKIDHLDKKIILAINDRIFYLKNVIELKESV